jgi:AraC-like DNA-binding protein
MARHPVSPDGDTLILSTEPGQIGSGLVARIHCQALSPHRFLKLRRMTMVRVMLLSGSGPWHSVKAAALTHGFWHLGQFAHDYRAVFGEAPSETLTRAR